MVFKIGEFSKLSNITVWSLRHYESLGILSPDQTDPDTGYRHYSAGQLESASKIRMLREVGFSLGSIKGLLKADSLETARQYYELRQTELEDELKALNVKKEMIRYIMEDFDHNESTDCYHAIEKHIPQKTVLSAYRVLPSYDHVKDFWSEFFTQIRSRRLIPKMPLFLRSLCLDKEYKEADVEVELHIDVEGRAESGDTYRIITTPAVHAASVIFSGGYKCGHAVRRSLARWLEVNRYGLDGAMFNTPHIATLDDPDPDHWVNEWG
ncbi:MAG: MerR family transcriptional regulator, partial [Treponema sp.]|nr:MerR family transcriptional regulator [Treponema sp.]